MVQLQTPVVGHDPAAIERLQMSRINPHPQPATVHQPDRGRVVGPPVADPSLRIDAAAHLDRDIEGPSSGNGANLGCSSAKCSSTVGSMAAPRAAITSFSSSMMSTAESGTSWLRRNRPISPSTPPWTSSHQLHPIPTVNLEWCG